jgi:hypothetical protein
VRIAGALLVAGVVAGCMNHEPVAKFNVMLQG